MARRSTARHRRTDYRNTLTCILLQLLFTFVLWSSGVAPLASAESDIQAVVDYAKEQGVQVIIVSPNEATEAPPPAPGNELESIGKLLADLKHRCAEVLANLGSVPADIAAALAKASTPDGIGLFAVIVVILALMGVAYLLERLYLRWLQTKIKSIWPTTPPDMPGRMTIALTRFAGRAGGVVMFAITALVLGPSY